VSADVTWPQVLAFRGARQHLSTPGSALLDVAARILGAHAQVAASAELTLWARLDGLAPGTVDAALWEERTLVKTCGRNLPCWGSRRPCSGCASRGSAGHPVKHLGRMPSSARLSHALHRHAPSPTSPELTIVESTPQSVPRRRWTLRLWRGRA
jgi:hypothetical protein